MRTILHSDVNNFYASVEQIYNPEFKDLFFAVCGKVNDRHGIVLSKNNKAKAMGVKTGMPLVEAFDLCPKLVAIEAHFDRYIKYSNLVMDVYRKYTDRIESFGIDEAWLDVTNSKVFGTGEEIADKIRSDIRALELTCSVGVSFNKAFAKLGSDFKKPDATTVFSYENYKETAWKLPASELLMVGRATMRTFQKLNITTIGDIARAGREFIVKNFGKIGEAIYTFAIGADDSPVKLDGDVILQKSIGNSMTCYRDLKNIDDVAIVFSVLAESVSSRILDTNAGDGEVISISVKDVNLDSFTRQKRLDSPSMLAEDFYNAALELFQKNYYWKHYVRALGISVSGFGSNEQQISIFSNPESYEKKIKTAKAVAKIRKKFGAGSVQRAIFLKDKRLAKENTEEGNKDAHTIHPKSYFK